MEVKLQKIYAFYGRGNRLSVLTADDDAAAVAAYDAKFRRKDAGGSLEPVLQVEMYHQVKRQWVVVWDHEARRNVFAGFAA